MKFQTRDILNCGVLAAGLTGAAAQAQQPNIIFIMADDLGWADTSNSLTNLGDPSDFYETPALERIASEGMAFTNAYANQNCAPTRTAILSGAYAPRATNNVYQVDNLNRGGSGTLLVGPSQGTPNGNDALPTSTITHAETLQTAGYTTAYIGKFHTTNSAAEIVSDHGFDFNFGGTTTGGPGNYHASGGTFGGSIQSGLDPYAANYTQTYVDNNIKPYANGTSLSDIDALVGTAKHVTDASADAAIDFMTTMTGTDPFFIQYSSHAVHTPIGNSQARDDLLAKYQALPDGVEDSNASFGALIEGLDQSVNRLVDYLEATPDPRNPGQMLDQNTVVVFYSDNGGRQSQSNNSVLKGQKGELDEGGVRVPMIAWSGNSALVDGGTINDEVVMPIDFYKTFASLGGATLPGGQTLDGVDLSGVIADNTATSGRDSVFWHLPGYLVDSRNQRPQSVIQKRDQNGTDWKLIYNYEDQSWELYDLDADIDESNNLADTETAVRDALGAELLQWLDDVDAPLATLRSGSIQFNVTGDAYADGAITTYNNQALTFNAGDEVPIFLATLSTVFNTYVWDGSEGDGNWTNGPGFPNSGSTGANWTFNGGAAGQLATPDGGSPSGNAIDYEYTNVAFVINNATINEDVQIKVTGGALTVTNSTISLLPSSTNTSASLSGLNLGQNGTPTDATFTDSTLNVSRSNSNGNALRVRNGSSLTLVNSAVNVDAETGSGNLTLEGGASTLSIDTDSSVTITGGLEVLSSTARVDLDGGSLDAGWIRLNSGGNDPVDHMFTFAGGTVTLSDVNPVRDNSSFEGAFNWTGAAGSGTVTHTGATSTGSDLAFKVSQGFFSIDGTRVDPTTTVGGSSLAAFNSELASLAVNGRFFEIEIDGNTQTLSLLSLLDPADLDQDGDVDDADFGIAFAAFTGPNNGPSSNPAADLDGDGDVDDADFGIAFAAFTGPGGPANVPEPTSLALLALGGAALLRRRRIS